MQPLHLHIEDEIRVQLHILFFGNDLAQLFLLGTLHSVELANHIVVDHGLELCQLVHVLQEVAAHPILDQLGQLRVAQAQPAPGGDTVGLVLEPLGEHVVPVLKAVVLQDLGVDGGHAVDVGAHIDAEVGHMGGVVLHDEQARVLPL